MSEKWAHFEDASEAKGYTQISNAVMRSPQLSMAAKYLYGLLKSYAWQDPTTHPGLKRMCHDANASDKTLGKYLQELQDVGLIEVKRRGQGKTNLYVFKALSSGLDSDPSPDQETDKGSGQETDTGPYNEDSVNEDSVTNSRRGAKAPKAKEEVDPMVNIGGYFNALARAAQVHEGEDETITAGNLKRLVQNEDLGREERLRVCSKIIEARTAGFTLSPQKAWNKVRFGNVTPLRSGSGAGGKPEPSEQMVSTAGYRTFE